MIDHRGSAPGKASFPAPVGRVQHWRCRFVHEQFRGGLQVLGQPIHNRAKMERRYPDPVRQRGSLDVDAGTSRKLRLSALCRDDIQPLVAILSTPVHHPQPHGQSRLSGSITRSMRGKPSGRLPRLRLAFFIASCCISAIRCSWRLLTSFSCATRAACASNSAQRSGGRTDRSRCLAGGVMGGFMDHDHSHDRCIRRSVSLLRGGRPGVQRLHLAPVRPGAQRLDLRMVQCLIPSLIACQVNVMSSRRFYA